MAKFIDVFEDVTKLGTKIPTNLYLDSGLYPIIDQGQSEIAGYTNEEKGLFIDVPAIVFGDHTRVIKYIDNPCFLGADGVKLLKAKDKSANYKYLYYALCNADIPNTGYNRHFKWLKEIEIPDYLTEEQVEIVAQLERVDSVISLRKQQLAKLDELVKSRFIEMFGDYRINEKGFDCKTGSELFKFSSGKFLPEEKRLNEGIPVYGGNGIAWYTSESLVDYSTIIIGRVGAQCGNIHAVTTPVWITDNAIYIKEQKTNAYTLEFLTELMRMMDFYQYADFSGQPKITQKPLETLNYIMPPIELQNEYTAFVEQIDKSKIEIQKSLNQLETLKKALMQKYFG
ncbi:MAG: restriction endonuclease subunit S [Clostridia bacterium]|nr:restriction endonuclease subunit S [Clostridia bacterium]